LGDDSYDSENESRTSSILDNSIEEFEGYPQYNINNLISDNSSEDNWMENRRKEELI
jgi:hypothetical protein